jgi:hypothetical protein
MMMPVMHVGRNRFAVGSVGTVTVVYGCNMLERSCTLPSRSQEEKDDRLEWLRELGVSIASDSVY